MGKIYDHEEWLPGIYTLHTAVYALHPLQPRLDGGGRHAQTVGSGGGGQHVVNIELA